MVVEWLAAFLRLQQQPFVAACSFLAALDATAVRDASQETPNSLF
jgi:hypothetical protein